MNRTLAGFRRLPPKARRIARSADIVVDSYAFILTADQERIQVVDINDLSKALVMTLEGDVLKTSMSDRELAIVARHYRRNSMFIGNGRAPQAGALR